jgi:holliday junction DNA helicase RuvA
MIGSVRGTLLHRTAMGEITVEAGGVGYRVMVGVAVAGGLGRVGDDVFVWTHHVVREDAEKLFGFVSIAERETFEQLLGAPGVGPSLAQAILAVHSPTALRQILLHADVDALCLVPGIGKKTATKLIVELKSKLDLGEVDVAELTGATPAAPVGALADVRGALAGLGYTNDEIKHALADLPADLVDQSDAGVLLRVVLAGLGNSR